MVLTAGRSQLSPTGTGPAQDQSRPAGRSPRRPRFVPKRSFAAAPIAYHAPFSSPASASSRGRASRRLRGAISVGRGLGFEGSGRAERVRPGRVPSSRSGRSTRPSACLIAFETGCRRPRTSCFVRPGCDRFDPREYCRAIAPLSPPAAPTMLLAQRCRGAARPRRQCRTGRGPAVSSPAPDCCSRPRMEKSVAPRRRRSSRNADATLAVRSSGGPDVSARIPNQQPRQAPPTCSRLLRRAQGDIHFTQVERSARLGSPDAQQG